MQHFHPLTPQGKDKCPGCGVTVIWTGLYGPWCSTCMPRAIPMRMARYKPDQKG